MTEKDLKNALLQEAVQGKLVPQIAAEGNARDLLEEIRKERGESLPLSSARKRSSATPSAGSNTARNAHFAPITEDEIPFEIPENWCWCRLGELISLLTDFSANGSYEKLDSNVKMYDEPNYALMVRTTDLERNDFSKSVKYIDQNAYNLLSKSTLYGNEIIMNKIGSAGKIYIMPCLNKPATLGRNVFLIRFYKFLNTYLIFDFLSSPYGFEKIKEHVHGAVTKTITKDDVKSILFPLPPLAEQKRIVAAIEKFMPLIEEYGKKETELKAFNEQIGSLTKKAILQEAVQGKLVPQIPVEGNAKDLLEEIKKEKAKVAGKASSTSFASKTRTKELSPITEDEIPFDIPESWCWCKLGDIVDKLTDGTHRTPKYVEKGIPFLSVKNLSSGKMDFENTKFITLEEHKELYARCNPEKGDMLLTKVGTTGIPVINDSDIEFSLFVSVALIKFNHDFLDAKFFLYLLQSPLVQEQAKENTRGVGNKNWVMDAIANTILVLPPLAEQKRIVNAIEKLLPLCEKLGE